MKRKVLISVLAVALVLTLCICMFVACDPKPKKSAPKVTVYGTDGKELGTEQSVDMGDGTYSMTDPAQEYTLKAAQYTYFTYQLYDPATKEKKGAFDYRSFTQDSDFSVIVVAESIGDPATKIDDKWLGEYYSENQMGQFSTVEFFHGETSDNISLTLQTGQVEPIEASGLTRFESIWTKNGNYIIEYDYELTPEGETTEEPETYYTYYAFALSADGKTLTLTNLSDIADGPYTFTKKPEITVTVHYTLGGQDKTATMKANSGEGNSYSLNNPVETLEYGALLEALQVGETYNLYYYDAAATGHKGAAFDKSGFTAEADFDIIVVKETVGTHATAIDASWNGDYSGSSMRGKYSLTIDATKGSIAFNAGMMPISGTVGADGTIFTTADGKLVLAGSNWMGEWDYTYYYFTKNADGTITVESDSANATLGKVTSINVTIYYTLNGVKKSTTGKATGALGKYELEDLPELLISKDDSDTWNADLTLGKKIAYYYYNNNTKGDEFNWREFEAEGDISIIIEIETFATPATKIDAKYNGTFTGEELMNGPFKLTIDATAGTIKFEFTEGDEYAPEPVDASITKGTVLNTTDGKLMFTSGTDPEYSYWFYLSEKDGTYTLESSLFYGESYELTKA